MEYFLGFRISWFPERFLGLQMPRGISRFPERFPYLWSNFYDSGGISWFPERFLGFRMDFHMSRGISRFPERFQKRFPDLQRNIGCFMEIQGFYSNFQHHCSLRHMRMRRWFLLRMQNRWYTPCKYCHGKNYQRFLKTFQDFSKNFQISQRFLQDIQDFSNISKFLEDFRDLSKISGFLVGFQGFLEDFC